MSKTEFETDVESAYGEKSSSGKIYTSEFGRGKWRREDWLMLKCPRFDQSVSSWIQNDDHIANPVPPGASSEELMGKFAPNTFVTMVLRQKYAGSASISSTMSFDHQMAPLILIAPEYALDAGGRPEYRNHWEIVIYNEGICVWQHFWNSGKCSWRLAAHCKCSFNPATRYRLNVDLGFYPSGKELKISCGENSFSFFADALPDSYFVGLTACEGVNRFYDFEINSHLNI
jgi:hypothetical protein